MLKKIESAQDDKVKLAGDYLERLHGIYEKLPGFDCGDCHDCAEYCIRPVTFLIEFENVLKFIDENLFPEQKTKVIKNVIVIHHGRLLYKQLKNEVIGSNCIFRDNRLNKCIIYPARPMACRIYGLKGLRQDEPVCQSCERDCEKVKRVSNRDFDCSIITSLYHQIAELSRLFKQAKGDELCFLPSDVHQLEIWLSLKYVGLEQTRKVFAGFDHERSLKMALKDPCLKNREKLNKPRYYGEWKNAKI